MTTSIRGLGAIILTAALLAACTKKEEVQPIVEEKPTVFVPPAEPARAAFTPKADANYTLVARKANKCFQFTGANTNGNAHGEIWTCNGTDAQLFTLQPVAGGYFSIVNVRSKMCLDVVGGATGDGAGTQQYPCMGQPNQQWIVADGSTGGLRIVSRHSGKVLDVADEAIADGTQVNTWTWKGMAHQEFTLVPVPVAADTSAKAGKSGKDGGATAKSKKKKS